MDRSSVKWFRIDSKVHHSGAQPKRAQRPLSASSLREMHSSNVYVSEYNEQTVPLGVDEENDDSQMTSTPCTCRSPSKRCTNDVRALWLETAEQTPTDRSLLQRASSPRPTCSTGLYREDRGARNARRKKRPKRSGEA